MLDAAEKMEQAGNELQRRIEGLHERPTGERDGLEQVWPHQTRAQTYDVWLVAHKNLRHTARVSKVIDYLVMAFECSQGKHGAPPSLVSRRLRFPVHQTGMICGASILALSRSTNDCASAMLRNVSG